MEMACLMEKGKEHEEDNKEVLVSLYYDSKRRGDKPSTIIMPEEIQRPRLPNKPRSFTVKDVSSATPGFGEYEALGT
ncbi:hypothetical protein NL676_017812 [Syzygium grande]|nr:hypothetical protein NL676_017812 [Syzygium grande]